MKKKFFFLPLLAALVMAGCSKEDSDNGGGSGEDGDGAKFLAINIVSNTSDYTRTRYDNEGNKLQYEDGTGDENKVTSVRLYFFNDGGNGIKVKKDATGNYYDVPESAFNEDSDYEGPDHDNTVEKKIKAFIMIDAGEQLPTQVVAVINYTKDMKLRDDISRDKLCDEVYDYAKLAKGTTPSFVMMNSVYANKARTETIKTTKIASGYYKTTKEAAEGDPVIIYVERNVAKVRVNVSSGMTKIEKDGDNLYKVFKKETKEKEDNTTEEVISDYKIGTGDNGDNPQQVYVRFEGWDVTADLSLAYLSKHIAPAEWIDNYLGAGTFWNDPDHHRCYWASGCNGGTQINGNQYFEYNDGNRFTNKKFDETEYTYCNENADDQNIYGFKPTVVIVKGTLCNKDNNPLTITEYASHKVIDDANCSWLKQKYVWMLTNETANAEVSWSIPYKKDGEVYKPIEPQDLTFVPAPQINPAQDGDANKATVADDRYYVYACLTNEAKDLEWYDSDGKEGVTPSKIEATAIDAKLKGLSHAKIWKTGQTYYYAEIEHYKGKSGVVRNHIYDITLKSIVGIGTPVYDETLKIIPEKPKNDETYVAAEIDILSWRLRTQDVDFKWD